MRSGGTRADSDDEPLITPSAPATIPAQGMLPHMGGFAGVQWEVWQSGERDLENHPGGN